jgi:hypothetical protein
VPESQISDSCSRRPDDDLISLRHGHTNGSLPEMRKRVSGSCRPQKQ